MGRGEKIFSIIDAIRAVRIILLEDTSLLKLGGIIEQFYNNRGIQSCFDDTNVLKKISLKIIKCVENNGIFKKNEKYLCELSAIYITLRMKGIPIFFQDFCSKAHKVFDEGKITRQIHLSTNSLNNRVKKITKILEKFLPKYSEIYYNLPLEEYYQRFREQIFDFNKIKSYYRLKSFIPEDPTGFIENFWEIYANIGGNHGLETFGLETIFTITFINYFANQKNINIGEFRILKIVIYQIFNTHEKEVNKVNRIILARKNIRTGYNEE